jgi:hypothetical protein
MMLRRKLPAFSFSSSLHSPFPLSSSLSFLSLLSSLYSYIPLPTVNVILESGKTAFLLEKKNNIIQLGQQSNRATFMASVVKL